MSVLPSTKGAPRPRSGTSVQFRRSYSRCLLLPVLDSIVLLLLLAAIFVFERARKMFCCGKEEIALSRREGNIVCCGGPDGLTRYCPRSVIFGRHDWSRRWRYVRGPKWCGCEDPERTDSWMCDCGRSESPNGWWAVGKVGWWIEVLSFSRKVLKDGLEPCSAYVKGDYRRLRLILTKFSGGRRQPHKPNSQDLAAWQRHERFCRGARRRDVQ